jgi:uncharacterized membrane protein
MLRSWIASFSGGDIILELIEYAGLAIEILAVTIITVAIFWGVARYFYQATTNKTDEHNYRDLKVGLARTLLLGLEILVAADIVRTVALEATLESVVILGLLVLIRTFLSWSLVVETEGRWPWQKPET